MFRVPLNIGLIGLVWATVASASADVPDGQVEEALVAAKENCAELERVLAHFETAGDREKLLAARFLIAHMPGHGYVRTALRDKEGKALAYDPLAYPDFEAARDALDALEKEHGELEFGREDVIYDVETLSADFLIGHVDRAFKAWRGTPPRWRVGFEAFLEHVLPHRGSQEPVEDWITPLRARFVDLWSQATEPAQVAATIRKQLRAEVRFNKRFYLHPTDQGFSEMMKSGQGRCEDLTNLQTFAMRSVAVAVAADYTPYWGHGNNNHAWMVMLDAQGRGHVPAHAHAAKVYRKTYSHQRDGLAYRLPEGREAPNRFLASKFFVDVTDQYAPTEDVRIELDATAVGDERFAYLCVFNGGDWRAIQWAEMNEGRAQFDRAGRNIAYLTAVHDGQKLIPVAPPLTVEKDGSVTFLPGRKEEVTLLATSTSPAKVSPDTGEVTPVSRLKEGETYTLHCWDNGWTEIGEVVAGKEPLSFETLPADSLYWLVCKGSRKLERIFTIENGRQRWW